MKGNNLDDSTSAFTCCDKAFDAGGKTVSVRDALVLINQTLDEILIEQEGSEFDADTRWALAWFEQYKFDNGDFGVAETLSKTKNTSVHGMVDAGILKSSRGKVRLFSPNELPKDWNLKKDKGFTIWEATHHMVRLLDTSELDAAKIMSKLGSAAEPARKLTCRFYHICEQKKYTKKAQDYNALVQSWPEISHLAKNVLALRTSPSKGMNSYDDR